MNKWIRGVLDIITNRDCDITFSKDSENLKV